MFRHGASLPQGSPPRRRPGSLGQIRELKVSGTAVLHPHPHPHPHPRIHQLTTGEFPHLLPGSVTMRFQYWDGYIFYQIR